MRYKIPVRQLKRMLTVKEFRELAAYKNLYTLDPEGWDQTTYLIYMINQMLGGKASFESLHPRPDRQRTSRRMPAEEIERNLRMRFGGL